MFGGHGHDGSDDRGIKIERLEVSSAAHSLTAAFSDGIRDSSD